MSKSLGFRWRCSLLVSRLSSERCLEDHELVVQVQASMNSDSRFLFRKNYAKYEFFRNPLVIAFPHPTPTPKSSHMSAVFVVIFFFLFDVCNLHLQHACYVFGWLLMFFCDKASLQFFNQVKYCDW